MANHVSTTAIWASTTAIVGSTIGIADATIPIAEAPSGVGESPIASAAPKNALGGSKGAIIMAKTSESPTANQDRYEKIEQAWETLAPDASFGKMTLAQFKARIKPSADKRAEIKIAEDTLKNLITQRDAEDIDTLKACDEVVKGVVGDPDFGDDCGLYGAMGYKLKSEYKSGLTRKKAEIKPTL